MNTYGAVLLGMVYALLPFVILPVYSSVEKMDWSLVDAGRDMGAGPIAGLCHGDAAPYRRRGSWRACVLTFVPAIGLFFMQRPAGRALRICTSGNLVRRPAAQEPGIWPFAAAVSVVLLILTLLIIAGCTARFGGESGDMTLF